MVYLLVDDGGAGKSNPLEVHYLWVESQRKILLDATGRFEQRRSATAVCNEEVIFMLYSPTPPNQSCSNKVIVMQVEDDFAAERKFA